MAEDSKMTSVSRLCASVATGTLLRVATLSALCALATVSSADAALYYWQDSQPGFYRQMQPAQWPRRQKAHRATTKKEAVPPKETAVNPQGPLIISVSINNQKVKIYDTNGFFAEAPVSTGMRGHPTPMGVFSVIQKQKLHHSNIYSGAPMPFMQRITWSGVAMHAGVLPGYPASHGCIRMPPAFAIRMYNWTKMGARVFVTPGDIPTPSRFSHPLLPAFKVAPQPETAELPPIESHAEMKADRGAPAPADTKLELKSTVGHDDKPESGEAPTTTPRDQSRAPDAGETQAAKSSVTMSSVPPAAAPPARENIAVTPETIKQDDANVLPTSARLTDAAGNVAAGESDIAGKAQIAEAAPRRETGPAQAEPDQPIAAAKADGEDARAEQPANEAAKVDEAPAEARVETAMAETSKPEDAKPEEAITPIQGPGVQARPEPAADAPKVEAAPVIADARPEPAKSASVKVAEAADDRAKLAGDASAKLTDAKKDQTRLTAVTPKPEPPKRAGQIAVFISRKDSKLYVRQNFSPLYEVPVTIAPGDRQLGTHVFTAEVDKTDPNALHWSVVSLPMSARAIRAEEGERLSSRRRKGAPPPVEAQSPPPAPDSPTEALDRITVPQDAMARIAEALTTGGSIIVSDQGINQGETGEGTDFIVSLR
jgi:lipoprotein-anchoring transpeptidase ErfK/SrfK